MKECKLIRGEVGQKFAAYSTACALGILVAFGIRLASTVIIDSIDSKQITMLSQEGLLGNIPLTALRENGFDFDVENGSIEVSFPRKSLGESAIKIIQRTQYGITKISEIPSDRIVFVVYDDPNTKATILFSGLEPGHLTDVDKKNISENNLSTLIEDASGKSGESVVVSLSRNDYVKLKGS